MGGTNGYCRPVEPVDGRMSSWRAHTNRGVPSTEPGTDYYCPRGTPVRAAAGGLVVDVGDSIQPATGRYVTLDLADGRRVRYLHLERRHVNVGDRVEWGQHIADSGATGYGEADWSWNVAETGGAHVHMTLWERQRYTFGRYATLDPELYMGSAVAPTLDQGAEMYIIRAAGRTPTLVGPGYVRSLNDEEAGNIGAIVSKDSTVNARQFDLIVSSATTGTVSGPSAGPFIASSPNRNKTLFGDGYVRELSEEEANNAAGLHTNRVFTLNDRQFDLAVSVSLTGQTPKVVNVAAVTVDAEAISKAVVEKLDLSAIAKAVNDDQAKRLAA